MAVDVEVRESVEAAALVLVRSDSLTPSSASFSNNTSSVSITLAHITETVSYDLMNHMNIDWLFNVLLGVMGDVLSW